MNPKDLLKLEEELKYEIAYRKTLVGRLETFLGALKDLTSCVSVEVFKLLKRLGIK